MADEAWDAERIARLRHLAVALHNAESEVESAVAAMPHSGAWSAPLDDALSARDRTLHAVVSALPGSTLLSLLDALEEARERERNRTDELQRASEQVAMCAAELRQARAALASATDRVGWLERVANAGLL